MNTLQLTALRIALAEAVTEFDNALEAFAIALRQEQRQGQPAFVFDAESGNLFEGEQAWNRAIAFFQEIEYRDEQDAVETIILPGVLGVGPRTFEVTRQLNAAKNAFQTAYQNINKAVSTSDDPRAHRKESAAKQALERMGRARTNLKQVYRNIVLVEDRPDRIGLSWTATHKIEKLTRSQARTLVANSHSNRRAAILAGLDSLPASETHIAYKEPPNLHLRANLLWKPKDTLPRRTVQRCASLPLLVLNGSSQPLPTISPLKPRHEARTRIHGRADQRVESQPFVAEFRLYRYKRDTENMASSGEMS